MPWPFETVTVVRHGEAEWNRAGRRQGQLDSPLTAEGEQHAEALAASLGTAPIDAIFSSPLGRADRTAEVIAATLHQPVRTLETLAEVHHGVFAGLTNEEIETSHPGALARRQAEKFTWRFPDGESYADAEIRASEALTQIAGDGSVTPLLVTHEMIGRMLLKVLLNLRPEQALTWSLPHGAIIAVSPATGELTETTTTRAPLD